MLQRNYLSTEFGIQEGTNVFDSICSVFFGEELLVPAPSVSNTNSEQQQQQEEGEGRKVEEEEKHEEEKELVFQKKRRKCIENLQKLSHELARFVEQERVLPNQQKQNKKKTQSKEKEDDGDDDEEEEFSESSVLTLYPTLFAQESFRQLVFSSLPSFNHSIQFLYQLHNNNNNNNNNNSNSSSSSSSSSFLIKKQPVRNERLSIQRGLKQTHETIRECQMEVETCLNDSVSWIASQVKQVEGEKEEVEKELEELDIVASKIYDLCDQLYHSILRPRVIASELLIAVRAALVLREFEQILSYAANFFQLRAAKKESEGDEDEQQEEEEAEDRLSPELIEAAKREVEIFLDQEQRKILEAPKVMLELIQKQQQHGHAEDEKEEEKFVSNIITRLEECGILDAQSWTEKVLEHKFSSSNSTSSPASPLSSSSVNSPNTPKKSADLSSSSSSSSPKSIKEELNRTGSGTFGTFRSSSMLLYSREEVKKKMKQEEEYQQAAKKTNKISKNDEAEAEEEDYVKLHREILRVADSSQSILLSALGKRQQKQASASSASGGGGGGGGGVAETRLNHITNLVGETRTFLFRHRLAKENNEESKANSSNSKKNNNSSSLKVVPQLIDQEEVEEIIRDQQEQEQEEERTNSNSLGDSSVFGEAQVLSTTGSFNFSKLGGTASSTMTMGGAGNSSSSGRSYVKRRLKTKATNFFLPHRIDEKLFPSKVSSAFESICLLQQQLSVHNTLRSRVNEYLDLDDEEFRDVAAESDLFSDLFLSCENDSSIPILDVDLLETRLNKLMTVRVKAFHFSSNIRSVFVPQSKTLSHLLSLLEEEAGVNSSFVGIKSAFFDHHRILLSYLDEDGDRVSIEGERDWRNALTTIRKASAASSGGSGGGSSAKNTPMNSMSASTLNKTFVSSGFHELRLDIYIDPAPVPKKVTSSPSSTGGGGRSKTARNSSSSSLLGPSPNNNLTPRAPSSTTTNENNNSVSSSSSSSPRKRNILSSQGATSSASYLPRELDVDDILRKGRAVIEEADRREKQKQEEQEKKEEEEEEEESSKKKKKKTIISQQHESPQQTLSSSMAENLARLQKLRQMSKQQQRTTTATTTGLSSSFSALQDASSSSPSAWKIPRAPVTTTTQASSSSSSLSTSAEAGVSPQCWRLPRNVVDVDLRQMTIVGDELDEMRLEQQQVQKRKKKPTPNNTPSKRM